MTIIRPTTINARFSQPVGLGGEKLWLCPTLGGDRLDLSGNGNHGTYQGGMGTVADKYKGDRAFDFDGVNDYISTGRNVSQTNTQTFSAWSYLDTQASQTFISSCYTSGGSTSQIKVALGVNSSSQPYAVIQNTSAIANAQSSTVLPISQWFHVCGVFIDDGGVKYAKLFVNGNLDTTASGTGSFPILDDTLVGVTKRSNGAAIALINGLQDDIRVFSRALTPSEIKHLASKRGVLGSPRQPYDPLKRTVVRVPAAVPAATKVGSIKKPTTIIKPSYQAGYARNASESENPKLWDGLVGAWMPSLGVTGETLRDVSGNGNHCTLNNMDAATDWVATSKGLALDFDGSDDYITCGSIGDSAQTITVWAKSATTNWNQYGWISSSRTPNGHIIHPNVGSKQVDMFVLSNNSIFTNVGSATPSDITKWHQYTLTTNGSNEHLTYLDGDLVDNSSASISRTVPVSTGTWFLGRDSNSLSRYGYGKITNVSIYNRVLSPTEIKQLYVDSLAPFRRKQRVSVAVPAAVPTPSATYHPLRSLAHPLEQ